MPCYSEIIIPNIINTIIKDNNEAVRRIVGDLKNIINNEWPNVYLDFKVCNLHGCIVSHL